MNNQKLGIEAPQILVDYKKCIRNSDRTKPPVYSGPWRSLTDFSIEQIERNDYSTPSRAILSFPAMYWHEEPGLSYGDMVSIRSADNVILFEGFLTSFDSAFSGASVEGGAWERCAVTCLSYMWLLHQCPVYGQFGRTVDDYFAYGEPELQEPLDNAMHAFKGRRCIFNADGFPNMDPDEFIQTEPIELSMMLFGPRQNAQFWSVFDMIQSVAVMYNNFHEIFPTAGIADWPGLSDLVFNKTPHNICCEGLSLAQALELLCRQVGWAFKEVWHYNSPPTLAFYKPASAWSPSRDDTSPTVLHTVYAGRPDLNLKEITPYIDKILYAMDLNEDISEIVNMPWGLGDVYKFEITAELVPGWKDSELTPDTANIFLADADLEKEDDPNALSFFKYYHSRGSEFKNEVGRLWVLNETGNFTADPYDRGDAFDFSTVLPAEHAFDADGTTRKFGPFARSFLPPISIYENTFESVQMKVEFSFDGGSTWKVIPCPIINCKDQCGIIIQQPNLSDIKNLDDAVITDGTLNGVELNYWTSLCDDKLTRIFQYWKTRVRITASVAMDDRVTQAIVPSENSGSPFYQARVFDFSDKYALKIRTESSTYAAGRPWSNEVDCRTKLMGHLTAIHEVNQDRSVAGRFTLDRLWVTDGSGQLPFDVGDCIERINGRNYALASNNGPEKVYPEIIQVILLPKVQKTILITRDLRFSMEAP